MAKLRNTADIFYSNLEQIDHKQMICKHLAKAYVEIAYFAHQNKGLDDAFLISVLRSMKMGSMKGAQLFPCILNVPNLGTTLKTLFLNEVCKCECSLLRILEYICSVDENYCYMDAVEMDTTVADDSYS